MCCVVCVNVAVLHRFVEVHSRGHHWGSLLAVNCQEGTHQLQHHRRTFTRLPLPVIPDLQQARQRKDHLSTKRHRGLLKQRFPLLDQSLGRRLIVHQPRHPLPNHKSQAEVKKMPLTTSRKLVQDRAMAAEFRILLLPAVVPPLTVRQRWCLVDMELIKLVILRQLKMALFTVNWRLQRQNTSWRGKVRSNSRPRRSFLLVRRYLRNSPPVHVMTAGLLPDYLCMFLVSVLTVDCQCSTSFFLR